MGLLDDLREDIDDVLEVRDDLGAALAEVFLVTRTWDGGELGIGDCEELRVQMLPTPRVVRLNYARKLQAGGETDSSDIRLKMVSRESYPERDDVDCSVDNQAEEKFYEVDGDLYRVIDVELRHVTWSITLRRHTDQTRGTQL